MPITKIIKNSCLPLTPVLGVEASPFTPYPTPELASSGANPPISPFTMAVAEAAVQQNFAATADPTRQVLDSIAKLKNIFADESLGQALSRFDLQAVFPDPISPPDSAAVAIGPVSAATKLKHMLEHTDELIVCPGVYDGLSARAAMEVGFDALYMVLSCPFFWQYLWRCLQVFARLGPVPPPRASVWPTSPLLSSTT